MSFIETPRFPVNISFGSVGGPAYSTTIAITRAGHETRNQNWSYPLHRYNVIYGIKTITDYETLLAYFHAMAGKTHGFRYKDYTDFQSCGVQSTPAQTDQTIGTGDGAETDFQIIKNYTTGSLTQVRNITKPISGTVLVEVNAVLKTEGVDYSIDYTTGIITFTAPVTNTHVIKAGYQFDVPVRFDVDYLPSSAESCNPTDGQLILNQDIPLVEIRIVAVPT